MPLTSLILPREKFYVIFNCVHSHTIEVSDLKRCLRVSMQGRLLITVKALKFGEVTQADSPRQKDSVQISNLRTF